MHYPLTGIQADFEINRPVRYRNNAKKNIPQTTDGRTTDGRTTDGRTSRTTTIGSFFLNTKTLCLLFIIV